MEAELIRQITQAVKDLSAIPYFPQEEDAHIAIMGGIAQFAGSVEGVRWMVVQAVSYMDRWMGVPELRGIYCSGGWQPIDGRHTQSSIPSLSDGGLPAYYLPAPKLLAPPPPTPEEEAQNKAFIAELQAKVDKSVARKKLKGILFDKRYNPEATPDWLLDIEPGTQKPN
jgi:hypothetical protein